MFKGMTTSLGAQPARRVAIIAAGLFAMLFLALAIIGVVGMFSPVPFWDMWDGGLGFYLTTLDASSDLWFAQHNEHRIVLSRLLFWLDYELFGGMTVFLIVMNYVIVALAIILFWRIALERLADDPDYRYQAYLVACLVMAWLYQWMQRENLGWSFQSQFFLAQLLPLASFYLLHKSALPSHNRTSGSAYFFLACLVGAASAGTMANGVLALPLLTVYALVVRLRWWQVSALALLTALVLGLYFYDYHSPGHHGSVSEALFQHPLQLATYVSFYLGAPFYYLFGEALVGKMAAVSATAIMALVSLTGLYQAMAKPQENVLKLALVFGIMYLVGTAVGTGGGRLVFGVDQAFALRYTTPALMAWTCIMMLALPWARDMFRRFPLPGAGVVAILATLMLVQQFKALHPEPHLVFDRNIAGLALELGIRDEARLGQIYPTADPVLQRAEFASRSNLAMFGAYPWRDLKETIGQQSSVASLPSCTGHVDQAAAVPTDPGYIRVEGWLINNDDRVVPQLITIANDSGLIVGYALAGVPRDDVAEAIGDHAGRAGFQGYIRAEMVNNTVILTTDKAPCELITDLP